VLTKTNYLEEPIVPSKEKEKESGINRLKRIEGQVRGIERMGEDDRYCIDILVQTSAINSALRKVCYNVAERHMKHCIMHAIGNGEEDSAVEELLEVMKHLSK